MTLREQMHRAIDELDSRSLVLAFEQLQTLRQSRKVTEPPPSTVTLEDVLRLTSVIPGNWSDDIEAEREDRL